MAHVQDTRTQQLIRIVNASLPMKILNWVESDSSYIWKVRLESGESAIPTLLGLKESKLDRLAVLVEDKVRCACLYSEGIEHVTIVHDSIRDVDDALNIVIGIVVQPPFAANKQQKPMTTKELDTFLALNSRESRAALVRAVEHFHRIK